MRHASVVGLVLVCSCSPAPGHLDGGAPPPDLAKLVDLYQPFDDGPPPTHGPTGDPCMKASDCDKGLGPNQNPQCLKTQNPGAITWPGGYCTTPCRVAKNDPNNNGLNTDCPGGNATCAGQTGTGTCVAACQTSSDCRTDYACFNVNALAFGCEPAALSMCDPRKAASCARKCNGAPNCYEDTCVNIGDGTVGECVPGCDPFSAMGCAGAANATDCHGSDVTGEGLCVGACTVGPCNAGSACGNFYSDCPGGYGCLKKVCHKYCNAQNAKTQCRPNATCEKASMTLPVAILGICSDSD